jgi:hypothetical protein
MQYFNLSIDGCEARQRYLTEAQEVDFQAGVDRRHLKAG